MSTPVPIACTLGPAQLPGRVEEFRTLLAATVRSLERVSALHARMTLAAGDSAEAAARDLLARERECCAFFDFALTRQDSTLLTLDIRVPEGAEEILAELVELATPLEPAPLEPTPLAPEAPPLPPEPASLEPTPPPPEAPPIAPQPPPLAPRTSRTG